MKKSKIILTVAIILALATVFTACSISYGDALANLTQLQDLMSKNNLDFKYAQYMPEGDYEKDYIAQYDSDTKKYTGYKIYYLSAPFYISIYAYDEVSQNPESDNVDRLTKEDQLDSDFGKIQIYTGTTQAGNLFVIGVIDIDDNQYEIRVVNDKQMKDGKYVNAISKDNANYEKARQLIIDIINSLK